jgi:hypothetical protein
MAMGLSITLPDVSPAAGGSGGNGQ